MIRRTGVTAAVATSVAMLSLSATAMAATKVVYAGPPPGVNKIAAKYLPKSFPGKYNPDINNFFRQRVTVHVGDTVSFHINGFHTVDLPGKSKHDLALILPGPPVSSAVDAAGNPFWFQGLVPNVGLDPALFSRSKGKHYNGTQRLDSGAASTKPFNVKFTKPGVYKYFCDVHPGMVGWVVVKANGTTIPTVAQDKAAVTNVVVGDVKTAKKLAATKVASNTIDLGEGAKDGVQLYAMFPQRLSVNAGTVVNFRMPTNSDETHTATFGPQAYLKPLAKGFQGGPFFPAIGVYPSSPSSIVLTPTSHGNGYANTGVLDRDPSTKQIPPANTIDFTTPGTYHYQCLIHPFMHGTIVVK
jgi:plastocyanin